MCGRDAASSKHTRQQPVKCGPKILHFRNQSSSGGGLSVRGPILPLTRHGTAVSAPSFMASSPSRAARACLPERESFLLLF
jgi:hypothetical protein